MTGHAGAGGGAEKLRSRFGDRGSGRRGGEKGERQREGGEGVRGPGDSGAAAARSRRSRDGLSAEACADPQPQGTKRGRAAGGGESGAQRRAGRRAGARARGAGGRAGLPRVPHIRAPARRLGGPPRRSGELWLGSAERADHVRSPPAAPCVRAGGARGAGGGRR